jgi:hypothetical protein
MSNFYFTIYFQTNTIKSILGDALILYSRIKPSNKDKASINVCVDTPYMSSMVYASTVPPVLVGISYVMWYRYSNYAYLNLNAWTYLLTTNNLLGTFHGWTGPVKNSGPEELLSLSNMP